MTTLVLGASGATGKHLVEQLLKTGNNVKMIVRSSANIPDSWSGNDRLTIIKRNISDVSVEEMSGYVANCESVACCLGHNLTMKGIYGKPRKLVTGSVRLLCESIIKNSPAIPIRFVLMNTAGNSNRDIHELVTAGQRLLLSLLRLFLPPHPDNEKASDYLRVKIGQENPFIEWVVVRPDTLINEDKVSEYSLHISPIRNALFNPGKTSRINVGHFMAQLLIANELWQKWKGKMPVIYNEP